MTGNVRYYDPWKRRWGTLDEYLETIRGQITLARTWRYRASRVWQRLLQKPVLPDERYLTAKLSHVKRMGAVR